MNLKVENLNAKMPKAVKNNITSSNVGGRRACRNVSKPLTNVQTKSVNSLNKMQTKVGVNNNNNDKPKLRFLDENLKDNLNKYLRKRKTKNYAELSVCSPNEKSIINKSETHMPIYLKQDISTKPNKKIKDPFEFVAETPRGHKRRLKNQGHLQGKVIYSDSNSDSVLYDKETHDILKKLEAKEEAKLRGQQYANKKLSKMKIRNANIQKPTRYSDIKTNKTCKPLIMNNKKIPIVVLNRTIIPIDPKDDIKNCFGFDDLEEEKSPVLSAPASCTSINKPHLNIMIKQRNPSKEFRALTSTPISKQPSIRNKQSKNTKKIRIISDTRIPPEPRVLKDRNSHNYDNIQLDHSIIRQSHPRFPLLKQGASAATSTPQIKNVQNMVNMTQMQANSSIIKRKPSPLIGQAAFGDLTNTTHNQSSSIGNNVSSPWRSDSVNISRNPHFLAMKDTFLPSYNQQMVLDSKLLEKQSTPKTISIKSNEKQLLQSSMTDFVNSSSIKPMTPSRTVMEQSLFDDAEFSPLKSKKTHKIASKSPTKVKRNVLGILKPSNRQNLANAVEAPDVNNFFGFDSFGDDENDENKENKINTPNTENAIGTKVQPTRIGYEELLIVRKIFLENLPENVENVDSRKQNSLDKQKDAPQVALFEDLEEVKKPRRSYERKRARRVRIRSVDSDVSEEVIKPKVKRKDVRTPQEEAEFNKWVAEFNAMCDEVENHTLETD